MWWAIIWRMMWRKWPNVYRKKWTITIRWRRLQDNRYILHYYSTDNLILNQWDDHAFVEEKNNSVERKKYGRHWDVSGYRDSVRCTCHTWKIDIILTIFKVPLHFSKRFDARRMQFSLLLSLSLSLSLCRPTVEHRPIFMFAHVNSVNPPSVFVAISIFSRLH